MPLPPRELALWPLRAALSSGLASLLSLAQSTVFSSEAGSNVLSSPVFGTVVAIVCSTKTRGEVVGTAWGVLGGACMGCVLSALCAALFGPSLGAVLFSNALVGALVAQLKRVVSPSELRAARSRQQCNLVVRLVRPGNHE